MLGKKKIDSVLDFLPNLVQTTVLHVMNILQVTALRQAFNTWLIHVRIFFLPSLHLRVQGWEIIKVFCKQRSSKLFQISSYFQVDFTITYEQFLNCLFVFCEQINEGIGIQHQLWKAFEHCSGERSRKKNSLSSIVNITRILFCISFKVF